MCDARHLSPGVIAIHDISYDGLPLRLICPTGLDAAARDPGSLFPGFHFIASGLRLLYATNTCGAMRFAY